MKKLAPLIHDTENGLDYILVGEIYLPLIAVPEETSDIGFYGSLRRNYLRDYKSGLYSYLSLSGKLWTHLAAGGYVHHMAVCNGISYPVGNHLYHSCIGVWIRTGNRHRGIQNACNGLYTVCFAYPRRLDCGVAGSNQN